MTRRNMHSHITLVALMKRLIPVLQMAVFFWSIDDAQKLESSRACFDR